MRVSMVITATVLCVMLSPVRCGINGSAEAQDDSLARRRAQRADRLEQGAVSSHVELAKPGPPVASLGKDPNERHKRLIDDTAKLLQLSNELKNDVDKTTKDELSVQVIQKAAEIEKLAHDMRERMKG